MKSPQTFVLAASIASIMSTRSWLQIEGDITSVLAVSDLQGYTLRDEDTLIFTSDFCNSKLVRELCAYVAYLSGLQMAFPKIVWLPNEDERDYLHNFQAAPDLQDADAVREWLAE